MKKEGCYQQINLACQGIIVKNNTALELANHFIPHGNLLFSRLWRYDQFLAHQVPLHQIGASLIYLLPFLKAFGASDQQIKEYSTVSISFIPGAKKLLQTIQKNIPCFFVTSAYQPFVRSLSHLIGFDQANSYSTQINLDYYSLDESERETLKDLADEIIKMPLLSWSRESDLPLGEIITPRKIIPEHIPYLRRLEAIFQEEIASMQIGKLLTEITAQTGREKVKAIAASLQKTGTSIEGLIYIGHSTLDAAALGWVKEKGGLAVSFNGDQDALLSSQVSVISGNSVILAIISDIFWRKDKKGVQELIENWNLKEIQTEVFQPYQLLINELFSHEPESFPRLELITPFQV